LTLRHIDLYRLPDPTVDLDRIGRDELVRDPRAITVVEWADRLPPEALAKGGRLPPEVLRAARRRIRVRLAHGTRESERILDIEHGA
jgi:tRNA A37 threonylcarbamoyladenosine biosynthesis protein TsaE